MRNEYMWLAILIAIIMMLGSIGIALADQQESEKMQACVSAGMEWVRDFGNYYECKEK